MVREGDLCRSPPRTRTSCACIECGGAEVGIQGLIAGGVNAPGGIHAPLGTWESEVLRWLHTRVQKLRI